MDTRQLAAFCAVVERKSFSQAAERLGVTQPAVSLQVRALEERLGQQLLDRSGPAGRADRGRTAALPGRAADAPARGAAARGRRRRRRGPPHRHARARRLHRPGRAPRPPAPLRVPARTPGPARLALDLGHPGGDRAGGGAGGRARGRRRAARATARSSSSRWPRTRSSSPCRRGTRPRAARSRSDALREETLIVMQEGAGVRQVVEEELRRAGLRVRGLEPRLELGLQESVKSAVAAGYGVAFISRTAIEGELAAGTLACARVAGIEPVAAALRRPREGPPADAGGRGLPRVRRRAARVIVRWGLESLPGAPGRARDRTPAPDHERRWASLDMPAARAVRGRPPARPGGLRGGGGRGRGGRGRRSSRSAAAAPSTRPRRSRPRPACRSSPSRPRTPAPSGRRSSARATRSGASRPAAAARTRRGSSTTSSSPSGCRRRSPGARR